MINNINRSPLFYEHSDTKNCQKEVPDGLRKSVINLFNVKEISVLFIEIFKIS